jgi:amino-acid N-acetyltransferase
MRSSSPFHFDPDPDSDPDFDEVFPNIILIAQVENFRCQGIAARLTNFIARYAVSHGIQKIYLLTMTAKDFFAKQGYLELDRSQAPAGIQATREFKDLCPDTAVCMCREL